VTIALAVPVAVIFGLVIVRAARDDPRAGAPAG
jgi:hypothetical protein